MKIRTSISLGEEELDMLSEDAPEGNYSAYIRGLIRNNHLMERIPKVGVKEVFYDALQEAENNNKEE